MVTGSMDNTAKVYCMSTGDCLLTLEGHTWAIISLCITPDGTKVVTGSGDRTSKVFDITTGVCMMTLRGHDGGVRSVFVSPDGHHIVTGSYDKKINVYNIQQLNTAGKVPYAF